MDGLTDEELSLEISRRSEKRKAEETSAISEKRKRLQKELEELDSSEAINSSPSSSVTSSSSATSSISASSSSSIDAEVQKQPKNSLFACYTKSVIDVEALDERRANEAKANSKSRESDLHRGRKGKGGSQKKASEIRFCSRSLFVSLAKDISDDDKVLVEYEISSRRIFCSACPCYVRDDNFDAHLKSETKIAINENLHQAKLETAISISTTLSNCVPGQTHLFRCELTRNLLTAAIPVYKADELRNLLQRYLKI